MAAQKTSSEEKWAGHLSTMSKQPLSTKSESIAALFRNPRLTSERHVFVEMHLYRIQIELEMWIADSDRASSASRDRYSVSLMKMIQDILRRKVITTSAIKAVTAILIVLGFGKLVDGLLSGLELLECAPTFPFIKLISSRTKSALSDYDYMAIVEDPIIWQLRLFGDYMDRSMDSAPDTRVSFEPDAWQRRVLDGIDKNKSLLVIGTWFIFLCSDVTPTLINSSDQCRKNFHLVLRHGEGSETVERRNSRLCGTDKSSCYSDCGRGICQVQEGSERQ